MFRFRDLPIEIQLRIFQLFKPPIKPEVWKCGNGEDQPSSLRTVVRASDKDELSDSKDWPFANNATAFAIACLDATTFTDFAPHLYQYSTIAFREPLRFSNNFLANATNACLYNLRYLRCILYGRNSGHFNNLWEFRRLPDVGKLGRLPDVFNTWPELRALERFELVYLPSFACQSYVTYFWRLEHRDGHDNEGNITWEIVDRLLGKRFTSFEQKLTSKALRGFQVTRGVSTFDGFGSLFLTFTRGGEAGGA